MTETANKRGLDTLAEFVSNTYAPGLHFGFAALWFLALLGSFVSVDAGVDAWIIDFRCLFGILTVFFALFLLRAADEIKDFDYDKVYNPDRPLVTGAVSLSDLAAYMMGTSMLLVAINAFLGWILVIAICVDIGYGLLLVWLEKRSDRVRNSIFLNLLVTYPVNVGLSVYTYFFFLDQVGRKATVEGVLTIIAFAAAFLHWEFCRKTYWPHHAKEGMRLYSNVIGADESSLTTLGFALAATGTMIVLIKPWTHSGISAVAGWLMVLPLLAAILGQRKFHRIRRQETYRKGVAVMVPFGTSYLVLFYITLILYAALGKEVLFRVW